MKRTVYIISGPAGVGKTTISKLLALRLARSAYISGDDISHIPINGREKSWLSKNALDLIWDNIACLTRNLIKSDFDVVIDYVTFPAELCYCINSLSDLDADFKYVVLQTSPEELIKRDLQRSAEQQMGERCLDLYKEFDVALTDWNKHLLDTQESSATKQFNLIANQIITDERFSCQNIYNTESKGLC